MNNHRILISGASIAGPAVAYWLQRYGYQATIVERASGNRPGGQAIDLRGTARDVAERMGIMSQIRAAHSGAHGMTYVNHAGKPVASMASDLLGDSGGAIAELEILRDDLVRILYDATAPNVEYIFDDSIRTISEQDSGLLVTFASGDERTFDLIIGADGLHSNVRRQIWGDEAQFIHDLGAYAAIWTVPSPVALNGWELMHTIPGRGGSPGRTAALYPLRDPASAKAMFLFGAPPEQHDRQDLDAQRAIVARAFTGDQWLIPQLLDAMQSAPDFFFDRVCQVQMERWSRGRVVLLGDAAYCGSPMSGSGTSMALVGAYVLAGELAAHPADHQAAFAAYEQQMREYVDRCHAFATQASSALLPKSRIQIWVRNLAIRALPHLPWRERIVGGMQETANLVKLKDYRRYQQEDALALAPGEAR